MPILAENSQAWPTTGRKRLLATLLSCLAGWADCYLNFELSLLSFQEEARERRRSVLSRRRVGDMVVGEGTRARWAREGEGARERETSSGEGWVAMGSLMTSSLEEEG